MGTTSWSIQDVQLSLEKLRQSQWSIEALCFHGHGNARMHTFRNTGEGNLSFFDLYFCYCYMLPSRPGGRIGFACACMNFRPITIFINYSFTKAVCLIYPFSFQSYASSQQHKDYITFHEMIDASLDCFMSLIHVNFFCYIITILNVL